MEAMEAIVFQRNVLFSSFALGPYMLSFPLAVYFFCLIVHPGLLLLFAFLSEIFLSLFLF
jgi:hypothetical protein